MQQRKRAEQPILPPPRESGVMGVRRKRERKAIALEVEIRHDDGTVIVGRTTNLSIAGAYIETASPAPFGSVVVVVVALPGFGERAEIDATVRFTDATGMGVQFGLMGAKVTWGLTQVLSSIPRSE